MVFWCNRAKLGWELRSPLAAGIRCRSGILCSSPRFSARLRTGGVRGWGVGSHTDAWVLLPFWGPGIGVSWPGVWVSGSPGLGSGCRGLPAWGPDVGVSRSGGQVSGSPGLGSGCWGLPAWGPGMGISRSGVQVSGCPGLGAGCRGLPIWGLGIGILGGSCDSNTQRCWGLFCAQVGSLRWRPPLLLCAPRALRPPGRPVVPLEGAAFSVAGPPSRVQEGAGFDGRSPGIFLALRPQP